MLGIINKSARLVLLGLPLCSGSAFAADTPRPHPRPLEFAAPWWVPGSGDVFTIARSGKRHANSIPFSYRICQRQGTDPTTVRVKTASGETLVKIASGQCLEVDRPRALYVSNYETQLRGMSGEYQRFRKGSFDRTPRVVPAPPPPRVSAEGKNSVANCVPVKEASAEKGVYANCRVPKLKSGGSYRMCFGKTYTAPQNNQNYPGTLVPLVIDLLLAPAIPQTNPDQQLWNPLIWESCRDLHAIPVAIFIVTPWRTNPADTTWKPELVKAVDLRIKPLK